MAWEPKYYKTDKLCDMFPGVGDMHTLTEVFEHTEIKDMRSLKTLCWSLRSDNVPPYRRMDLRINCGMLERIE